MQQNNQLESALKQTKSVLIIVFTFSCVVNILMLITPLYSLQVLDRVISSRNLDTLLYLTLLMLLIYIALTVMQTARSFTLIKLGEWLDKKLSPILFALSIRNSAIKPSVGAANNLRDFQVVKGFLTSAGINSFFDAPWSVAYIIILFIIHPWMGILAIFGAAIILLVAFINLYAINKGIASSYEYNIKSSHQSSIATRNAEVIEAMGMMKDVTRSWHIFNQKALEYQAISNYRSGVISNFARYMIRMVLQMFVTAISAYLVVTRPHEMSVGGMIASSIMIGRALAPFDSAIEVWKQVVNTKQSYKRLQEAFNNKSTRQEVDILVPPTGNISVKNLYFVPPSLIPKNPSPNTPIPYTLNGLSFDINAGEIVAIIGPSAAGKSTLAKLLVGVWKATQGSINFDDINIYEWPRDDFGNHVGYLPQDIELFEGSIRDNIARMQKDASSESIIEAAKMTGTHDMILRLSNGYETDIGTEGTNLSGGQRQRIGLARAYFGNPKFVVLDEPNANLDEIGEKSLVKAIINAKQKNITTVIISHRPSILSSVDKILVLKEGSVASFGDKEEILKSLSK